MGDRIELLAAALDLMDEGVVVLDEQEEVVFWNQAAAVLTGYQGAEVLSRVCPPGLYEIDRAHQQRSEAALVTKVRKRDDTGIASPAAVAGYSVEEVREVSVDGFLDRPTLVSMRHRLGHTLPAMLRKIVLRDALGSRMGAALLFHSMEDVDALPRGESGECVGIERSQADMEDRLDAAHHQWLTNRIPLGLLWFRVDQGAMLRKTHGRDACEAMMRITEQILVRGLHPAEVLGRWGDDEFLVVSHERTASMLREHAERLAGLARTAAFRWWGDLISISVSVGVSYAVEGDTLRALLGKARHAVQSSIYAGGNFVTGARGD